MIDMGSPNPAHVTVASLVRAEVDHRERCLECVNKGRYSDCYKLRRLLREFTNTQPPICARCGWPLSAYHNFGCPFAPATNKENSQ